METKTASIIKPEYGRSQEVGRFLIVGLLASSIHLATLYTLTEYISLWYIPATLIGFLLAFTVSFTLQKKWTFKKAAEQRTSIQLKQFFSLQIAALLLNAIGLYVLVEFFGLWYLAGQTLLIGVIALITFLVCKHYIFRQTHLRNTFHLVDETVWKK